MTELSEQAKAIKRAYYKDWRAKNKDKVREKNRRYWERRAEREQGVKNEQTEDC